MVIKSDTRRQSTWTMKRLKREVVKRLNNVSNELYEVELVKSKIECREPIVGFFILQRAKLRMPELHYYFSNKFCYVDSFEELEMDTDFLYRV